MALIPSSTINAMAIAADQVIGNVLLQGSPGMRNVPRAEVGFVAAVTLGGVPGIAGAWQPLLASAGFSLSVTGVFCHAAPLVRFSHGGGTNTTCELADLLIVVDLQCARNPLRIASLIQVKMAAKAKRVNFSGKSSVNQLSLYQSWPVFQFVDQLYGTCAFDLRATSNGDAGTFGIIDRHFKNSTLRPPIWTQHRPSPTPGQIGLEPTLGAYLANMANVNQPYFGRCAKVGGKDDWSKVLDLLLRVTYAKTFRHKPTLGPLNPVRGNTAMAFMLSGAKSTSRRKGDSWGPPFDGCEMVEDDNPGGLSVLHLTLEQLEELSDV